MIRLLLGMALVLLGGVFAALAGQRYKGWFLLSGTVLAQVFILPMAIGILLGGQAQTLTLYFSGPVGDAQLVVDSLSAFFILMISLGGLLGAIYSIGYMKMYEEKSQASLGGYYFFMSLLVVAMSLVTLVQNTLLFLIIWEIMSLSSFFLVSFEDDKVEVRQAALYYFVAMQIGVAFLIAGFGWSGLLTGDLGFTALSNLMAIDRSAAIVIFVLLFFGFGTKAGFLPMHTWLPLAHPAAPSGVSAMMSGIMIKTGIYGILRVILNLGIPADWLAYLVFLMGLAAGLFGAVNAIAQRDLKRVLAYHSIENIGIIGMGIGLGMIGSVNGNPFVAMAGYVGALLHVFNHFTFKSLLFYGAGAVYAKTHTRNIENLGGLVHLMPYTAALFLLAAMAISGLPLFNGFISEFTLYFGMAKGMVSGHLQVNLCALAGLSGLALIGVVAMIWFSEVFGVVFQGISRTAWKHKPSEVSGFFLLPMGVLAALILLIGLGAPLVVPMLRITALALGGDAQSFNSLMTVYFQLSRVLWMLGGLILFFVLLRWLLLRGKRVASYKTWDCGYQAASPRLQYTASSFASSFLGLIGGIVPLNRQLQKPEGMFPESAAFTSRGDDVLERLLIRPVIKGLRYVLQRFSWVQSGRTQQYILYGLIFLVLLIVWIIGVR